MNEKGTLDAAAWARIQSLFHEALSLPEEERAAFLERLTEEDPLVLANLRGMLAVDAGEASVMDRGLAAAAGSVLEGTAPRIAQFGPYRTESILGRGGMGVVYRAMRRDPDARVAIKVLRDPFLSPARQERFQREQQILTRLNHPAIARLYEANTLEDGTPYFVMELVEGTTLVDHCRATGADLYERLDLFRQVCRGVLEAHRHAVIHRDLKPSNIMVTREEASGTARIKLLDFGIAKELRDPTTHMTQTEAELRLMTPAYASPEQIRGEQIGVATDVYSLGVVLYELLTGRMPFDLSRLSPGQAEACLLTAEPEKPSVRALREEDGGLKPVLVPGNQDWQDLDAICLTAMHRDLKRRYASVEVLLQDLDRFFQHEPLMARPDSTSYRLGKFLKRHTRDVVAVALVVVVLAGLTAFYTWRLRLARDAALAEAHKSARIHRFMLDLFEDGEGAGPERSLTVAELMDRSVAKADAFDADPEIQSSLYQTLGEIYRSLGKLEQAEHLIARTLAMRKARLGVDHPDTASSLTSLGLLRQAQDKPGEAEDLTRQALEVLRRHFSKDHPRVAEGMSALGFVLADARKFEEAIRLLEGAVAVLARKGERPVYALALERLANARALNGEFALSEAINERLLALNESLFTTKHPNYADTLINQAWNHRMQGHFDKAERLYRQALEINLHYHGDQHLVTASNRALLGGVLEHLKKYDEATLHLGKALAIRKQLLGPHHSRVAVTLNGLANVALNRGDYATAESMYKETLVVYRGAERPRPDWIGTGLSNLGSLYYRQGKYGLAERHAREALASYAKVLPPDHLEIAIVRTKLGVFLMHQACYLEARRELIHAYETLAGKPDPNAFWLAFAGSSLDDVLAVLEVAESQ